MTPTTRHLTSGKVTVSVSFLAPLVLGRTTLDALKAGTDMADTSDALWANLNEALAHTSWPSTFERDDFARALFADLYFELLGA